MSLEAEHIEITTIPQDKSTTVKGERTFNRSGEKYLRKVIGLLNGFIDVYGVLETFRVTCPARQHAIKKLLCSGLRGKADEYQDLCEARDAIDRAVQLLEGKRAAGE